MRVVYSGGDSRKRGGERGGESVEQGRQRGVLMRGRLPARLGLRAVGGIAWRPWARRCGHSPPSAHASCFSSPLPVG